MRHHHVPCSTPSHNTHGETEDVEWWNEETFNNQSKIQFSSSTAGSFKFTDCRWEHCTTNGNGGAICLTSSNSILTVLRGIFIDCNTTFHYGGGIYVQNCKQLDAQDSLFYQCHATTNGTDLGGAGICFYSCPIVEHRVKFCAFIDCDCESDAGGISIYSCWGTQLTFPLQSSRFIKCRSLTISPEGGAVCYYDNTLSLGMDDCLFTLCSAKNGGGIFMVLPTVVEHVILFCFFHGNDATNRGKDIYFRYASNNPILCSFTTSTGGYRVYTEDLANHNPNWLPQGSIYFVNSAQSEAEGNTQFCIYSGTTELLKIISAAFSVQASQPRHNSLSHLQILPSLNV